MVDEDNDPRRNSGATNRIERALSEVSEQEEDCPLAPGKPAQNSNESPERAMRRLVEAEKQIHLFQRWFQANGFVRIEEIVELTEMGLTAPQIIDLLVTEVGDYRQAEWGRIRDVKRQTINGNVTKAKERINNE